MDEKVFVLGAAGRNRPFVRRGFRQVDRQRRTAGNRYFASVVESVSARGRRVSPLIIFKAKLIQAEWAEGTVPQGRSPSTYTRESPLATYPGVRAWKEDPFGLSSCSHLPPYTAAGCGCRRGSRLIGQHTLWKRQTLS